MKIQRFHFQNARITGSPLTRWQSIPSGLFPVIGLMMLLACSCEQETDLPGPDQLGKWESIDMSDGLSDNFVLDIFEDKSGNIWVGTNNGGLNVFDGQEWINYTFDQLNMSNTIFAIEQFWKDLIWFAGPDGLSYIDNGIVYTIDSLVGRAFIPVTLMTDSKDRLWVGTAGQGIFILELNGSQSSYFYNDTNYNEINIINEDESGNIWLGTDAGALYYDGNSFNIFDENDGLYSNEVTYILEDSWDYLWFATQTGELITRYDGNRSEPVYLFNGYDVASVFSMSEDLQGNIWFAAGSFGIIKYNGIEMIKQDLPERYKEDLFICSLADRNGDIWFGTVYNGILKYVSE